MRNGVALAVVLAMGCSDGDAEDSLQSACVLDILGLSRTLPDGSACDNFGYSDCKGFASECINVCAFDVCQSGTCTEDADCTALGGERECMDYVVSDRSYGSYCGVSDCPKGTPGCPCLDSGTCRASSISGVTVSCEAERCVADDPCPAGCRQGSVCCGGTLCSGDCIGTPCC